MRYLTKVLKIRKKLVQDFASPSQPTPWRILFRLVPPHPLSETDYAEAANKLLFKPIECSKSDLQPLAEYLLDVSQPKAEADVQLGVLLFNQMCKNPKKSDLIYYWTDIFDVEPSPSEVVELAFKVA